MAIAQAKHLGVTGLNNTATSSALTTVNPAPAGEAILVVIWSYNPCAAFVGVTDSVGNTYEEVLQREFAADGTLHPGLRVWACYEPATLLPSGGTITVNHGAITGNRRMINAFSAPGVLSLDRVADRAGTSGQATSGYPDTTRYTQELLVGLVGWRSFVAGASPPAFTTGDSWDVFTTDAIDGLKARVYRKIVNRKDRYAFAGSFSSKCHWADCLLTFAAAAVDVPDAEDKVCADSARFVDTLELQRDLLRDVICTDSAAFVESLDPGGAYPRNWSLTDTGQFSERCVVVDAGRTEAVRMGRKVPKGAVNLAWVQIPELDPLENLSLVDTGSFIAENTDLIWKEVLPGDGVFLEDGNGDGVPDGATQYTTYNPLRTGGSEIQTPWAGYQTARASVPNTLPPLYMGQFFASQIQVLHPKTPAHGAWHLRVQDGVMQRRHVLRDDDQSWLRQVFQPGDDLMLIYSVYESAQLPTPLEGDHVNAERDWRAVDPGPQLVEVLNSHTLQLPDGDLYEVTSVLVNGDELVLAPDEALSPYSAAAATPEQVLPVGPFTGWDPAKGTVALARSVSESDEIEVRYKYREYHYTFRGYVDDEGVYRDLNLNPAPGHTFDGGRDTRELLDRPVYIYLLPTAAYRVRLADDTVEPSRVIYSGYRWCKSFLRWELAGLAPPDVAPGGGGGGGGGTAFDPCLVRSCFGSAKFGSAVYVDDLPVDDNLPPPPDGEVGLGVYPSAILLAKVHVTPNSQVENVRIVDTRRRGGGVPVGVDVADIKLPGEFRRQAETYWDLGGWDGQPVPLAGVLLVELPQGLITGSPQYPQYQQAEIEQIVKSHVAAGVRVIIRYV